MKCDPKSLSKAAACLSCLPKTEYRAALIYALCQWASAPPKVTCDPDALTFLAAAGISSTSTEGVAVCQLVSDLKTYPLAEPAGNKYWDREILIYPFVGGNAAAHAINLRSPGTYDIIWHPTVTHSALGVQSDGAAGYGDTQYTVPNGASVRDAMRAMFYLDTVSSKGVYYGAANAANNTLHFILHGTPIYAMATGATSNCAAAETAGANFMQRISAANMYNAMHGQNWSVNGNAIAGDIPRKLFLLAYHANTDVANNFTDCVMSGFSFGTKFSDVSPTNTERLEYKGIWDTFQAALGRAHV